MTRVIIAMLLLAQAAPRSGQTGAINGQVMDVNGKPAAHIRVSAVDVLEGAGGVTVAVIGLAETNDDGRFRLEGVPPGRYLISAGPLISPTYYPGVPRRAQATFVTVTRGTQLDGMDFSLAEPLYLNVSGRVIGWPSGGKRQITLFPTIAPGPPFIKTATAAIEADGAFRFTRVPPGSYQPTPHDSMLGAVAFMPQPVMVTDEDITGVVLRVRRLVSGTVVMEGGDPQPRFDITFTEVSGTEVSGLSGSAGPLSVPGAKSFTTLLGAGNYRVTATGLPDGFVIKSLSANGGVDLLSRPFRLTAGGTPRIDIKIGVGAHSPWVKVSGRVTGSLDHNRMTGLNAGQLEIRATGPRMQEPLVVPLQRNGFFQFPKVVPGTYTLTASHLASPEVAITVGNSDLNDALIPAARFKEVPGRITIQGSGGLLPVTANFSVAWMPAGPFPSQRTSGALVSAAVPLTTNDTVQSDGSFTVFLPEGESQLTVSPEMIPAGYHLQGLLYGSSNLREGPLRITAQDSALLEVRIAPDPGWPRIIGRIASAATSMPEKGMIYGAGVFGKGGLQIEVKADGTFEFPAVTAGTRRARFLSSSPVPIPEVFIPAGVGNIEVSLPQIRKTPIHVTVEGRGAPPPFTLRLEGTIAAGIPAVRAAANIGSPATKIMGLGIDVVPLPDGTFPLTLPDGEYQLGITIPKASSGRYTLKSINGGGVNLTKNPLKVGSSGDTTIEVVFRSR